MKWLSGLVIVGTFAVLTYLEKKRPLRKQIEPKWLNFSRDMAIAATTGIAINFLEKPVTDKLTKFVEKKNFGFLKIVKLPKILETVLAVVLLDYTSLSLARFDSQTAVSLAIS